MSDDKKSAAAEIRDYEKTVNETLRRFYNRTRYEPTHEETPLDSLLASEDGQLDEWAVKRETARAILLWIAADGPHPQQLLERLYLMGDHMMIEPYCLLTVREKGQLCHKSHGSPHWLMNRIIKDPLRRKGARSINGAGQKGLGASAAASVAQQGNSNRSNGRAAVGRKTKRKPKKHHQ